MLGPCQYDRTIVAIEKSSLLCYYTILQFPTNTTLAISPYYIIVFSTLCVCTLSNVVFSSVDSLLNMGVYGNHAVVEIRVLAHQDLWIPCHGNENRVNTAAQWRCEDVADLQSNQESKCYDDCRIAAVSVVRRRSEDEVEVSQQGAGVSNEGRSHGQNGSDQTFVD